MGAVGGGNGFLDGGGEVGEVVSFADDDEIGKRIAVFAEGAVPLHRAAGAGLIRAGSGARELLAGSEVEAAFDGEERAVGAVAPVVEINRADERAAHGIGEERVDLGFRDFEGDEDF